MPEIKDSDLCPVKSFISYFEKLNPNTDRLWQRPRDSFLDSDEIWYNNVPVGKKTLSLFMSQLSQLCSLSLKYTNHSIRATGATLLSRAMFNPAQIMAVTGHKSVSSLSVYQRVSDEEKMAMGKAIGNSVERNDVAVVPVNSIDEPELDTMMQNMDIPSQMNITSVQRLPTFHGCQINNLIININK